MLLTCQARPHISVKNDLIKLLPPVVLGFGGLIPLVILLAQSSAAKGKKTLYSTIFILLTWIFYWVTGVAWGISSWDPWIILVLLVFVVIGLALAVIVQKPKRAEGKLHKLELPTIFAIAVALLSIASAIYVTPSGHDILHFDQTITDQSNISAVGVFYRDEASRRPLQFFLRFGNVSAILPEDAYKNIHEVAVQFRDGHELSCTPEDITPLSGPFLGNHFKLSAKSPGEPNE